jgi:hypothetical protein
VSAVTVSCDVVEIARVSESSIIEFCKNLPGWVHASTDAWTAKNVDSYMGVNLHYQLDGRLYNLLADFIPYVHLFPCCIILTVKQTY